MAEPIRTPYDDVLYPSALYVQTHPDRLATMARLFGLRTEPVTHCRVLELGCGDGSNVIAMAYSLPQSQFVGIDLAARPVANGKATIERLGLKNIHLLQLDLMHVRSDLGRFDFIIAHGLYSWVPAPVREQLLAICGTHLTERGVAYVSYHTYPGNHLRDMARGMMRYHAAHFADPQQQIRQARALLNFVAASQTEPDIYHQVLAQECERVLKYPDAGFFHDDLSSINQAVYFYEFMAQAAQHGLQYLAEADILAMQEGAYAPHVVTALSHLQSEDVIRREQYLDFLNGRAFRQTLLCQRDIRLDRTYNPASVDDLYVAADVQPVSPAPDLQSAAGEVFQGPRGAEIETDRRIVKTAFFHLGAAWPGCLSVRDLLAIVRQHLRPDTMAEADDVENDAQELAQALLQAYRAGVVELHAQPSPFVTEVSRFPVASALARLQLQQGDLVSTLRHYSLKIEDALSRHLVALLDGTRDHEALVEALRQWLQAGSATLMQAGKAVRDRQQVLTPLADDLEANLASLARLALLVA